MASHDPAPDDALLTAYLLGRTDASDTERLDELSIADDEVAVRLSELEHELVDAFVDGELSGQMLERFKAQYLSSPTLAAKVTLAEALAGRHADRLVASPGATVVRPARGWRQSTRTATAALAAAAVLLLAAGYVAIDNVRLRREVAAERAARAAVEAREQELGRQLADERAARSVPATAPEPPAAPPRALSLLSFMLMPSTRGAGDVPRLVVPAGTDRIQLRLVMESDDFPTYRAAIRDTASGRLVWRSDALKSAARGGVRSATIPVPSDRLEPGSYTLDLNGVARGGREEIAGNYLFTIARK